MLAYHSLRCIQLYTVWIPIIYYINCNSNFCTWQYPSEVDSRTRF